DHAPALLDPGLFLRLVPGALGGEPGAQAGHRVAGPGVLDLGLVAVAARVVGGGVVVQAIGHEFDHAAAAARARSLHGTAHALEHGEQVVAVHLQAVQAAGDALLRQGLGAGLRRTRHRDRPTVVDDALDEGQRIRAGR